MVEIDLTVGSTRHRHKLNGAGSTRQDLRDPLEWGLGEEM
jgi:hypothetical protein